ncbi:hypothetical protein VCHC02C1_1645B, partial [Vibrio cholerae HC-02C1]
ERGGGEVSVAGERVIE